MLYASISEIRAFDKTLAEQIVPLPGLSKQDGLLARAAAGLSDFVLKLCASGGGGADALLPDIYAVSGKGFNGADTRIAGQNLRERGFRVLFFDVSENADGLRAHAPGTVRKGAVVLDGVLGIGAAGAPRGAAREAIRWINSLRGRARIIATDVPSGWNADTGAPFSDDAVVEAEHTVCMGLPKIGMAKEGALKWCGCVHVNALGVPVGGLESGDGARDEMVTEGDADALIPPPRWDAHKGDFGHVVVVGGAAGYSGAPVIAARGALSAGAGLVSVLMPEEALKFAPPIPAELMVRAVAESAAFPRAFDFAGKVAVVGPGWGRFGEAANIVLRFANESGAKALVIDADGLNAFEGKAEMLAEIKIPLILTPHPGEAKRLSGEKRNSRAEDLSRLVELTGATVILKGAGTLVSAPGKGTHLIPFANPKMARGGTGDLLAGMCGAWLARGLAPFDAARVAAWKHADQFTYAN